MPSLENKGQLNTLYGSKLLYRGPKGDKGDKGDSGYTPVKGVDYFTEIEKQGFIDEVTSDVMETVNPFLEEQEGRINNAVSNINDLKDEYNSNAESKINSFNNNANEKIENFNTNAGEKTSVFNINAQNKTNDFNTNVTEKTQNFDSNASAKTSEFDLNATSKLSAYNENCTQKISEYNNNANSKLNDYNQNATTKINAFNDNVTNKTSDFDTNAENKTEAYNENATSKIQEYDEHIRDYEQEISSLEAKLERARANRPTVSGSGESITLNGTAEDNFVKAPLPIGVSEQETRSGKNKLNVTSVMTTYTASFEEETKNITLKQGFTNSTFAYFDEIKLKANVSYIFEIYLLKATNNTNNIEVLLKKSTDGAVFDNFLHFSNSSKYYSVEFTPTEDTIVNQTQFYRSPSIPLTEDITFKIQIREKATEEGYEEYGASPSPSYPSEIHNVGENGSVNVTVGNNQTLENWANQYVSRINNSSQATIVTFDSKNCLKYESNTGSGDYDNKYFYKDDFKANTSYKISYNLYKLSNAGINLAFVYTDDTYEYVTPDIALEINKWQKIVLYSNPNKTLKYIRNRWAYDGYSYIEINSFKVEEYQSYTFPLKEGQRLMQGDYLANDGVHHVRRQVVFDGSDDENWTENGSNQGYGIVVSDLGGNASSYVISNILCNKLKADTHSNIWDGNEKNIIASLGGSAHRVYLRIDETINTVTKLKTYLSNNPITVEYELAEEEVDPYNEAQQTVYNQIKEALSYQDQTNIYSIDSISPTFEVEAYADITNILQNLDARLALVEG